MTNQERLERIKDNLNPLGGGLSGHGIEVSDLYWLVSTVKEQQKEIGRLEKYVETLQDVHFTEMQTEKAENDRLRKALEKIGSPIIGSTFADMFELKQIARQALKRQED
ncbi:hypothetical protein [Siminovitchia sp. FSL W7-1587]|uniref:hypothetical protein n=1 Tax=Siminovitchia sp. FSL W7-1587 TaxID=2954699 RepID=UPI0030D02731